MTFPIPPAVVVPPLLTLAQAKAHLSLAWAAGDPREPDLQLKLDSAQTAIIDYIAVTDPWRTACANWTATTAPKQVLAAILLLTGDLWRFRGDDITADLPPRDPLSDFSPAIVSLLRRTRDPVVA